MPALPQPTLLSSLVERFTVTISNRYIFRIKHPRLNICFWELDKHCNHRIVVIFWPPAGKQEIAPFPDQSPCVSIIVSDKYVFHRQSVLLIHLLACSITLMSVFFAPPDDANIVSESTEIVDVSPSITTNVIGQKTDEGADMCERSCEELSTMFQELKGLRVVVSNLIDGLQKVVSSRSDIL